MNIPAASVSSALYALMPATATPAYAFGDISLLDAPYIVHDFKYTNTANMPIVIERLQPSCNCVSASIAIAKGRRTTALPYSLAPGDSVNIAVSIDLALVPQGFFSRSVALYLTGRPNPAATFTMNGTLDPDVQFTPNSLDFGTVHAGSSKTLDVTASVDNRLISKGFPKLTSNYPGIVITPKRSPYTGPNILKGARPGHEVDRVFEVTVPSNIAIGRINASLSFDGGQIEPPIAAAEFRTDTGSISGNVAGDIKADPEAVAFGAITGGETAVQKVTLIGSDAADMTGITIKSDTSFILARLGDPDKDRPNERTLTLSVSNTAPSGLFHSNVTIVLKNGQRLEIPAIGYVTGGR